MASDDDINELHKRIKKLQDDLKEAKRLHGILDEYATDGFKEVHSQLAKLREGLQTVANAVAAKKPKAAK